MASTLFEKGNPGGSMRKGKPLKKTTELKNLIDQFLDNSFEQVVEAFQTLSPKEQCQMFVGLLQYRLPKKQSVEVEPVKPIDERLLNLSFEQLEMIEVKAKPLEIGN